MPNSRQASISSRPLFIRVAESTEIFRPMLQFGWATACSGVARAMASRVQVRKGPPEAVSRILRIPGGQCPAGLAAAGTGRPRCARCRSGTSSAPDAATASISKRPAQTSDSLLASSTRLPARAAARVGLRPAAPTMAAMTCPAPGCAATASRPSSPARTRVGRLRRLTSPSSRCAASGEASATTSGRNSMHCSSSRPSLRSAASATTRKRSGWRRTTSRVLSPIDPVDPRIDRPFTKRPRSSSGRGSGSAPPPSGCRSGRVCRRGLATSRRCP